MPRKRKRRSAVVEIGTGPTKVRIYTINRKDGYEQFTLAWKEGGERRTRCFSCMDEAKMVGRLHYQDNEPFFRKLDVLKQAVAYLQRVHDGRAELSAESARLVAACAAFRKTYAKH